MAEFTKQELRNARDAQKISRWVLANEIGVSEDTIARWENPNDTAKPTPEDVDRIEDALGVPMLWHRWMLSNYDSYRKRYIGMSNHTLPLAVVNVGHQMDDVLKIQRAVERDAMTGEINDPMLKSAYIKELDELIAAATEARQQIK